MPCTVWGVTKFFSQSFQQHLMAFIIFAPLSWRLVFNTSLLDKSPKMKAMRWDWKLRNKRTKWTLREHYQTKRWLVRLNASKMLSCQQQALDIAHRWCHAQEANERIEYWFSAKTTWTAELVLENITKVQSETRRSGQTRPKSWKEPNTR